MATKINVANHLIVVDKTFVSGKDRVTIDRQIVFEGKRTHHTPQEFGDGKNKIILKSKPVSRFTSATMFEVEIIEQGKPAFSGAFDLMGQPVSSEDEARRNQVEQICGIFGVTFGAIVISGIISGFFGRISGLAGVFPRGILGSALAGGVGGALGGMVGYGLGKLLSRSPSPRLLIACIHLAIGAIFTFFVIYSALQRACLDLTTSTAIASFALAWGVKMSRPWAIGLQGIMTVVIALVYVSGASTIVFGPSLGHPLEFNVAALVMFAGPTVFTFAYITLMMVECGTFFSLLWINWALRPVVVPGKPSQGNATPIAKSESAWTRRPAKSPIYVWELAAIVPLLLIVLGGDLVVPIVGNALAVERLRQSDIFRAQFQQLENQKRLKREAYNSPAEIEKRVRESDEKALIMSERATREYIERERKLKEDVEGKLKRVPGNEEQVGGARRTP